MSLRNYNSTIFKNPLIVGYVLVWTVYLFCCLIVPSKSLYESTHTQAVLLVVVYVLLSAGIAIFLTNIFPERSSDETNNKIDLFYDYLKPQRLIILTGILVICGLILHLYDKIFIMNLDYSAGIAKARHEWIGNGVARGGGISSWQSVSGHILANLYFIVMLLVILFWEKLPKFYRYFGYTVSVITVLIYSASMGSRSVPLFFLSYVISVLILRKSIRKGFLPEGFRCLFVLLVILFFVYNIFVFHERGEAFGGDNPKQYTESFFSQLGGTETLGYSIGDKLPGFIGELFYYATLTTIYVTHNQWTFDYVLTLDDKPGQSMFNTLYGGLVKVGIIGRERLSDRAFSGAFLSLPGCAYYDYGVLGMIIISILHGMFIFVANHLVRKRKLRVWHVFLFVLVSVYSIISILTSAANLMSFPYLIISFLFLPFLVMIVKLPRFKPSLVITDYSSSPDLQYTRVPEN